MSKVFVDLGISLDGFIAGQNGGVNNPLGDRGIDIHKWMFKQEAFLQHLSLEGGETNNKDNDIIEEIFNRIGANIMGKNMFVEGEANWPEEAPFHCPVYVLTKEHREPWERPGGTIFYFVNDDIQSVLKKAKKGAGNKDVRISGGADVVRQYINAGLVDELDIHIAPILLGKGIRLFDSIDMNRFSLQIKDAVHSPIVTHINYKINYKQ
ncbi:MAG: dihydrofolate reductase [Ignavibacteriales bacterium]|nr:MAG: dihydrofolate reductase [Ignavibacteriales bacterium]